MEECTAATEILRNNGSIIYPYIYLADYIEYGRVDHELYLE